MASGHAACSGTQPPRRLIDDYAFGDAKSFRTQYARLTGDSQFSELKDRLKPVCHRTLRRQVLEYISFTNRIPITQEFVPTEEEQTLYDMVSEYLRRPSLQALPSSQRSLMTLIMRKLLASSTFAIAGALDTLARKLDLMTEPAQRLTAAFMNASGPHAPGAGFSIGVPCQ